MRPKFRLGTALIGAALAACVDSQAPQESRSPTSESGSSQSLPTVSYLSAAKKPPPDSDPAGFNITLRFVNEPSENQRAAFLKAAARWSSVITGDLPAVEAKISKKACGAKFGAPKFHGTIDDVLIDVIVAPIETGPDNFLGSAGPCLLRADLLPVYSVMSFNATELDRIERDVGNQMLDFIAAHYMGHALGFGTLWEIDITRPLLDRSDADNPRFRGPLAMAEYGHLLGPLIPPTLVPVEGQGAGPGAAFGHWEEATFGNELMTAAFSDVERPLSRATVGSMSDLGYTVNPDASEPYELPGAPAFALKRAAQQLRLGEELIKPIGIVQ